MLIFLDIDGVMVPAAGWKSPRILEDGFAMFSHKATDTLRRLISGDTGVMLTTSHKSSYSVADWKKIFEKRGIIIENLERLGANNNNLSRKEEIVRWFNLNSIDEDFVIIDDDKSLSALPPFLKEHLVLTESLVGLTEKNLPQIERIIHRKIFGES